MAQRCDLRLLVAFNLDPVLFQQWRNAAYEDSKQNKDYPKSYSEKIRNNWLCAFSALLRKYPMLEDKIRQMDREWARIDWGA